MRGLIEASQKKDVWGIEKSGYSAVFHLQLQADFLGWGGAQSGVDHLADCAVRTDCQYRPTAVFGQKLARGLDPRGKGGPAFGGAIDLVALLGQRSSAQAAKMTFAVAQQIGGWPGSTIAPI